MPSNNTRAKNFDEQETNILKEISEGNNRKDLYKKYGYSSIRTMDAFFRRRGFIVKNGQYIKRDEYRNKTLNQISGEIPFRAQMIADKFKKDGILANPANIAQTFGFKDYTEMNTYMRNNNMFYNSSTKTYEPHNIKQAETTLPLPEPAKINNTDLIARDENEDVEENSKYYSLLNYLYENKERLIELCTPGLSDIIGQVT